MKKTNEDQGTAAEFHRPDPKLSVDDHISLIYEQLRRLAGVILRDKGQNTLNPTALVNEAWLKLRDSSRLASASPLHFKRAAAKAMRHIAIDAARKRFTGKRGGPDAVRVTLNESIGQRFDVEMLCLDEALKALAAIDPVQEEMAQLRIFGLTNREVAEVLEVSESKVERDLRAIRAFLITRL